MLDESVFHRNVQVRPHQFEPAVEEQFAENQKDIHCFTFLETANLMSNFTFIKKCLLESIAFNLSPTECIVLD